MKPDMTFDANINIDDYTADICCTLLSIYLSQDNSCELQTSEIRADDRMLTEVKIARRRSRNEGHY